MIRSISTRTALASALAAVWLASAVTTAMAAGYPERPVKLIVPYPPGGTGDMTSRLIGKQLADQWGQQVVVENKPGASNGIGAQATTSAAKDGYTLFLCTTTISTNEVLYKKLPYKYEDLAPISLVVRHPYAVVTSPQLGVKTPAELVDYARKNPGKVNFATLGPGSTANFLGHEFMRKNGIEMTAIPYKGSSEVAPALISGAVHFYLDAVTTAVPLHRAGKTRIIGVTTAERVSSAPDIPTMKEQGFDFTHDSWFGLCTTAGTPPETLAKLGESVRKAVASDEFQNRMKALGSIPMSSPSPEAYARFMRDETENWRKIIEPLNLQLD